MKKKVRKTVSVQIGREAIEAAKSASALHGMSLAEYATSTLLEEAEFDIKAWEQFLKNSRRRVK